ncbi:MAG TPA: alpha/beta fold hydrolase [Blastocatellia bacterium]|nr:alpha/beta fold hydrolase [Blastocatellia bacterium]
MFDKLKALKYGLKVKWYEATRDHIKMIDLDGRKVQMMEGGEGEPLLYLHSAYGENLWLPFHQRLAEQFHVIAPAHPGFAQSEGIEEIDSMEDLIFHYVDLLDHLGQEKINIAGVSLGAWIAAEFATCYPDRVKKLALGCPAGLWLMDHPMTDMFALMRRPEKLRAILFHDPSSALAELLVPAEPAEEQLVEAYKAMTATARVAWNPPGHNPKLAGRLRRIKSPTLIIWGDDDKLIPTAYAEEWARHIKDSRVHLIKDCGHMIMFEGEAEFVRAVTEFLL